jgi:TPP-dependent pyruvate/acetoin dehydrogenase alpha subunit
MNFAGIHKPPVIFFCQNNGWAVSTPNDRQTATETFAEKGAAYGVRSVRVDGNDPLAVYAATREARELAPEVGATLIEAVTYRIGFHTSSDNPALYRMDDEVAAWAEWDPIVRTGGYLRHRGWWTDEDDQRIETEHRERLTAAIRAAEAMPKPGPESQFDDLYADEPWTLAEQREQLLRDLDGDR